MPPVLKDVKSKQIPKYIHSVSVFNICTWIDCDSSHSLGWVSAPFGLFFFLHSTLNLDLLKQLVLRPDIKRKLA